MAARGARLRDREDRRALTRIEWRDVPTARGVSRSRHAAADCHGTVTVVTVTAVRTADTSPSGETGRTPLSRVPSSETGASRGPIAVLG